MNILAGNSGNPPQSTPISTTVLDRMRGIALEIAKGIFDIQEILKVWEISLEQYDAITRHPAFDGMLREAKIEWESADNTVKRTQLKAAVMLEHALPELNARLHDRAEGLNAKVELAKFLGRVGGVDSNKQAIGGGGETFKIEINLGGDSKLKIEKELPARVIEAEAE